VWCVLRCCINFKCCVRKTESKKLNYLHLPSPSSFTLLSMGIKELLIKKRRRIKREDFSCFFCFQSSAAFPNIRSCQVHREFLQLTARKMKCSSTPSRPPLYSPLLPTPPSFFVVSLSSYSLFRSTELSLNIISSRHKIAVTFPVNATYYQNSSSFR
jgi:hypothetical protein